MTSTLRPNAKKSLIGMDQWAPTAARLVMKRLDAFDLKSLEAIEPILVRSFPRPLGRFVLRFGVMQVAMASASWQKSSQSLSTELDGIEGLIEGLSDSDAQKSFRGSPLIGLEPDAYDWSVAEVLEHLILSQSVIERIIESLVLEQGASTRVDLQGLKPQGGIRFHRLRNQFHRHAGQWRAQARKRARTMQRLSRDSVGSNAVCRDPIFGPMNSLEWQWFSAAHLRVHRRQIQSVLKGYRLDSFAVSEAEASAGPTAFKHSQNSE